MNIFIWGTSPLAGDIVGKYIKLSDVVSFVDTYRGGEEFMGKRIITPEDLTHKDYDAVIIASTYSEEIRDQALKLGIDINKMIFPYFNLRTEDINKDYKFMEKVLGQEYSCIVRERNRIIQDCGAKGDLFLRDSILKNERPYKNDFVRHRVLELCVKEIRKRKTEGAVAELGVFRGQFARMLSFAFPDDKLYLFDTFEGFEEMVSEKEIDKGTATDAWFQSFKNTSVSSIMKRMSDPGKVIVKQGIFPQTAMGLENEKFKFVSLDVDLYEPILDGLDYFYPRLCEGGYIFIHDYNGPLSGVEQAVDRYEMENGPIAKVPLCDVNGTMVITK